MDLLRKTNAYRTVLEDAKKKTSAHAVLVVFPDAAYLRPLLLTCAKAFFGAEDCTRIANLISEERFSDCLVFPSGEGKLTVDDASRILEESALRPVEGDKKLFVLDKFHTVPALVQNKLLKVFEEPPEGVYFLVGTTNLHAVLPTVRSRMKRIEEPPFSEEDIYAELCALHPEEEGKREAAAASGGLYSAAERLLAGGGESFRLAERFLSGGETELICRSLEKGDFLSFLSAVRFTLYDMLLLKTGQKQYASIKDGETARLAKVYPAGAIASSLRLVEEAERETNFNANPLQCAYHLALGIAKERKKWQTLSS